MILRKFTQNLGLEQILWNDLKNAGSLRRQCVGMDCFPLWWCYEEGNQQANKILKVLKVFK
jgi:hypothetical protein